MDTTGNGLISVRLLDFETAQMKVGSIAHMYFYQGKPPAAYIEATLEEIVEQNPWLQGRLVSDAKGKLTLKYPQTSRGSKHLIKSVSIPSLRFDMGFSALAKALKDAVIKQGSICLNKDEDLFRITVVDIADEQFALVISVSHLLADGYTANAIQSMLSPVVPIRPLIVERVHSIRRDLDAVIGGGYDVLPWLSSPGVVVNVAGALLRGRKPTVNLFSLDQSKIEARKREYEAQNKPKFISTNDIITAAFFGQTDCDLVFMVVNFRDRISHITSAHAGNYSALLAYQREDFATAALIRSSFAEYRRPASGKLPGFWGSARARLGIITNLAAFYEDLVLPGCKFVFHRPVTDPARFSPFEHVVNIFKSQDQLCLMTRCKAPSVLSKVDLLGRRIV